MGKIYICGARGLGVARLKSGGGHVPPKSYTPAKNTGYNVENCLKLGTGSLIVNTKGF